MNEGNNIKFINFGLQMKQCSSKYTAFEVIRGDKKDFHQIFGQLVVFFML
jgi:hypothetical protein